MKSHDSLAPHNHPGLTHPKDHQSRLFLGTSSVYVAIFAGLLASFPNRSANILGHLAHGRDLFSGDTGHLTASWLYDLINYLAYQLFSEFAVVGLKVVVVMAMAVVLFRTSRLTVGWIIPLTCTVLTLLAASVRFLALPSTVSYLFLALLIRFAWQSPLNTNGNARIWPGWPLVILFAIWTNIDPLFLVGLVVLAITWIGQAFDQRATDGRAAFMRRVGSLAILVAACALNPAYLKGMSSFAEIVSLPAADPSQSQLTSPFTKLYVQTFQYVPAVLAYYPLLVLSAGSFFLTLSRWRWALFLPWLALAILSGWQVRTIPLFAIVAGPVLAWNTQQFLASRSFHTDTRPFLKKAAPLVFFSIGAGLLACAWPGWLQGPPFEPRRWAVETPTAMEQGANVLRAWHTSGGGLPPGSHTLHVSSDTYAAFRWYCPEDDGVFDPKLSYDVFSMQDQPKELATRLKKARIQRLVIHQSQRGLPTAILNTLLLDPVRWPLLHFDGGLVIFGYRGSETNPNSDPFVGRVVDLNQLGYQPPPSKKAPRTSPAKSVQKGAWSEAFRSPAPPRPYDRDEATVLLHVDEAMRLTAPSRHLQNWESLQVASLFGLPGGWVGLSALSDTALRLNLMRPPIEENQPEGTVFLPFTQLTFAMQQRFVFKQGDVPPAVLYSAVRAARRSLITNPSDATTFLILGKCYLRLQESSYERPWTEQFPQYVRLRRIQATVSLNRAVELNPQLAEAHLLLSGIYRSVGCLDLALSHLQSYLGLTKPSAKSTDGVSGSQPASPLNQELDELNATVAAQINKFVEDAGRSTVADRALLAARRGLIGTARDILLSSDVSAFGAEGTKLELELLMVTGRAADVLEWATPEVMDTVGRPEYHWLRAQAFAAAGDYDFADQQLTNLAVDRNAVSPQRVADGYAQLIGSLVLEERVGMQKTMSNLIAGQLGRMDFNSGVTEFSQILSKRADASTLRGILALEAGEIELARDSFRAALELSVDQKDGLQFPGRTAAQDSLRWINTETKSK